jgi:GMP synthase (glutamine-hydrolysing)
VWGVCAVRQSKLPTPLLTFPAVRVLAIVHEADAGPGVFAQAIRERGAELHEWRPDEGPPPADPRDYDAVLTFGGAMHPDQQDRHPWLDEERALLAELIAHDVPLLGVCLGAQLLAGAAGARVRRADEPEIGWYPVHTSDAARSDPLLNALPRDFDALEWHSYEFELPPGATALAASDRCLQAFRISERAWAIQFHAEVTMADFDSWLADYGSDPDAVALNLDRDALGTATRERIQAWNDLGRGLCARFLELSEPSRGA